MAGDAWGGAWNGFWGGSWGFDGGTTPPPTPTPTVTTGIPSGVGRAWRRDYENKLRLSKKKRTLLGELDDILLDLRERIEEAPEPEVDKEAERLRTLQLGEDILATQRLGELTLDDLRRQIALVQAAIREIDDEEVLMLMATIH